MWKNKTSLGVCNLNHPNTNHSCKQRIINKIQTELNRFIWAYKALKVKHTLIMGTQNQSGLGSIDVKSKYKAGMKLYQNNLSR